MTITAIILAHYKERQGNLKRIVDDLMAGIVVPEEIVVFIDNPEIEFEDDRVTIIKASRSFLPRIRFAIGCAVDTDYCFFIDDDLTVRKNTLSNFLDIGSKYNDYILGLEGSILGNTQTPYANDTSINRGVDKLTKVDVIIRTYFVPTRCLGAGLRLQAIHNKWPREFLDDVYLCLGNKYLNKGDSFVIPVDEDSDLTELDEGGVGQSVGNGKHYENRNVVTRLLMDKYE